VHSYLPEPSAALRILVADPDDHGRTRLADQLTACGHLVVAEAVTGEEVARKCALLCPDVVLLALGLLDGLDRERAQAAPASPMPGLVLLTDDPEIRLGAAEMARTGAATILVNPARSALLNSSVRLAAAQARVLAGLRQEAGAARRQIQERKIVDRAKGILMRRIGGSDADAAQLLEPSSRIDARSLHAVARDVIASEPGAERRPYR
jgi:response regulator NasT